MKVTSLNLSDETPSSATPADQVQSDQRESPAASETDKPEAAPDRTGPLLLLAGSGCLLIVIAVVVVFIVAAAQSDSHRKQEKSSAPTLNASMYMDGSGLSIINNESYICSNASAIIQQGALTFYTTPYPDIPPHQVATVSFFNFVNTSNERFNYFTTKPQFIIFTCTINGQERSTGWRSN